MRLMNTNYCTEAATVLTASSSDPSFPVSNLKNPFRSKRWRSTDVTSESVVFDMITTEPVDSALVMWSKEDGILLSNTAVVKLQANATNTWMTPAVDIILTINNVYELATHYFTSDQNYRYWRVVVEDPGNPNGFLELGVVWIGKSLVIPNAQNGFTFQLVDTSKVSVTDFGHTYVDEYPLSAALQFQYQYLDYATVQILENAYRTNGIRKPVVLVLDAEEQVFVKDHFIVYGKLQNKFGLTHVNYNLLNTDGMAIVELS